jgi:hypothetical protein
MKKPSGTGDGALEKLRTQADALSRNPVLVKACHEACHDKQLQERAVHDPMNFLRTLNIPVPKELTLEFFERPPRYLPFPDWTPFLFELTNCHTYWLRECDNSEPPKCEFKEVEVCFGFRIYPNPVWPGPRG